MHANIKGEVLMRYTAASHRGVWGRGGSGYFSFNFGILFIFVSKIKSSCVLKQNV